MLSWLCVLAKPLGTHAKASLPCLLLPLHRTFPFPQPSQKHINRFVPHHVLASLVKGEVLSPEKFRATTGGIVTPPTFFKTALSLAPHHAPASLVKGEVLSPEKIRATTGGIAPYPHQPSQTRTIPRLAPHSYPPLPKVSFCC